MPSVSRPLAAVLLIFALAAGQSGVCAGWLPTPDARMACCSADGPCAMHGPEPEHGVKRGVTQADADRCCAASEPEDSTPSPSSVAPFVTLALALSPGPALLPAPGAHSNLSRASVPIPAAHVPRHLLLSVFLV